MAKKPTTENHKKQTEKTWNGPEDARSRKGSGEYPNQHVVKTRSGHSIIYDDSKDHESITIQHRGGSAIQFMPDGAVHMTAHNGKYDIVFGENRMTVTGANDLTVKGDGSLRVFGNYRKTVHGDVEISATGSINMRGQNINQLASENHTIVAEQGNHKFGTAAEFSAPHVAVVGSDSAALVGAQKTFVGGKETQVAGTSALKMGSEEGKVMVHAKSSIDTKSDGPMRTEVAGNYDVKASGGGNFQVAGDMSMKVGGNKSIDASQIHMQSGRSKNAETAQTFNLNSNKVASFSGQQKNNTTFA
jgi:hypothetical protein